MGFNFEIQIVFSLSKTGETASFHSTQPPLRVNTPRKSLLLKMLGKNLCRGHTYNLGEGREGGVEEARQPSALGGGRRGRRSPRGSGTRCTAARPSHGPALRGLVWRAAEETPGQPGCRTGLVDQPGNCWVHRLVGQPNGVLPHDLLPLRPSSTPKKFGR